MGVAPAFDMIESIFDPGGTQTEQSGSTFLGPRPQDRSQMPPGLIDGRVGEDETADLEQLAQCEECPGPPGLVGTPFDFPLVDGIDERENVEVPGML
jgi:hypothetical protein